jgi:hypothetical protein
MMVHWPTAQGIRYHELKATEMRDLKTENLRNWVLGLRLVTCQTVVNLQKIQQPRTDSLDELTFLQRKLKKEEKARMYPSV